MITFVAVSEFDEKIMAKKFTIKKRRLRARAEARRWKLKVNPIVKGFKPSVEQQNVDLIRDLEAKVKAISAKS